VSPTDVLWLLPALAGLAFGWMVRPTLVGLLLGFTLVLVSFYLFGYSIDHYDNADCQAGAPCPTGEHVLEYAEPLAFIVGATVLLASFFKTVWTYGSGVRRYRRQRG
jgi:hypothetical protein